MRTALTRLLVALRAPPLHTAPPPDAALLAGVAAMLSHTTFGHHTFRSEASPHVPTDPRHPRL